MSTAQVLALIPSPPQGVWQVGPFPIRAYALCILIGIFVALWWGSRRWIARGGQPGEVLDVAIWAVPFGLIGGRAYHVMTDWRYYFTDLDPTRGPLDALKIWDGGLGIWGAVALGAVGAWIGCRRYGIKLPAFGDAIAPPILLAQAIGRLGNYFNQEVFGRPTDLPWGLQIFERVNSSGQLDNLAGVSTGNPSVLHPDPVHPTFLYELLWNVFFVLVLVAVDRYFRIGHGRLFALYVMGYCFGRFFIELVRDDPASEPFGMGIRVNSIVAVVVFACALAYFLAAPRGRELGLSMYWPKRAEVLAAEGKVGYVDPWADDSPTVPDSAPTVPDSAPSVPGSTPTVPESAPSVPESAPSVPESAPSVPESAPSVPSVVPADVDEDAVRIVSATREIAAPASAIFDLIADPAQQPRFDGNENLQEADEGQRVTAVGDSFRMTNTSGRVRDNKVVEFVEDRVIAWLPSEVDKAPPGHLWRWELKPVDEETTSVTHTYDWTRLSSDETKRIERARGTTSESLLASLDRLAEVVEADAGSDEPDATDDVAESEAKASGDDIADADDRPNIVKHVDADPAADTEAEPDDTSADDSSADETVEAEDTDSADGADESDGAESADSDDNAGEGDTADIDSAEAEVEDKAAESDEPTEEKPDEPAEPDEPAVADDADLDDTGVDDTSVDDTSVEDGEEPEADADEAVEPKDEATPETTEDDDPVDSDKA
ncbi:prolipoprotein diacylglyceryl transferase [Gordonia araii NBRC 100433]|nr:prolipoprotein diacylglyceryl transferase [Gordonia araii NBRC 100433]